MEKSTLKQSKLAHWLMSDYANFQNGNMVGYKVSKFELLVAKHDLKTLYLRKIKYKPSKKPLNEFLAMLDGLDEVNIKESIETLKMAYIKSVQDFCICNDDFSLALSLMSKEAYNKFIRFLFDFMNYNQIPYRSEIVELLQEQQEHFFLFQMLKYKKCYICGNYGELHHLEQVGTEGYKSDYGQLTYTCLCRKHHSEVHSDARALSRVKGIKLSEKELQILKTVYKNHFRGENKNEKVRDEKEKR